MSSPPLKYILSERGHEKLTEGGFVYVKERVHREVTYWKREFHLKKRCPARLHTIDNKIVHRVKDHVSHVGNAAAVEAAELRTQIRERAENCSDARKVVIADCLAAASQSGVVALPVLPHLK